MTSILCRSNSLQRSDGFRRSAKRRKKNCGLALRNRKGGSANRARAIEVNRPYLRPAALTALRQIAVEKAEHVRMLDRAHTCLFLQVLDAPPELFHFGPVNLWTEMMFGVIAVIKKQAVVN